MPGLLARRRDFNPRIRVGCDEAGWWRRGRWLQFQSTHPCRMRRGRLTTVPNEKGHFNPRIRVGCDRSDDTYRATIRNFNPRIRVGCDVKPWLALSFENSFQSTHPCRMRRRLIPKVKVRIRISIHASV